MNIPRPSLGAWPTRLALALAPAAAQAADAPAGDFPWSLAISLLAVLIAGAAAFAVWRLQSQLASAIASRDDALDRLQHMAQHDPLTGLPNRRLLADRLSQAIYRADRQGSRVAVCGIDLDRPAATGDAAGPDRDDALLAALGQRLSLHLRATDTVGRLDSDEFVLVLGEVGDGSAAYRIAGEVQRLIAEPLDANGQTRSLGASIGIALYPDHGRDTPTLLRKANAAMREARRQGSGQIQLVEE